MFNIIIINGRIVDGSGNPTFTADIGISGDKIARIGHIRDDEYQTAMDAGCIVIDARGKVVTPGFIDPHTHVDSSVLIHPEMEPYLKQGVTTVVTGNCGYSVAPQGCDTIYWQSQDLSFAKDTGTDTFEVQSLFYEKEIATKALKKHYNIDLTWHTFGEFLDACDHTPVGCNQANLVGFSAVRTAAMGKDCLRAASEEEISVMRDLVKEAMEAGAFGLSTGRDPLYVPGSFASEEETKRMLSIVKAYDGIFTSHTFNYNKQGEPDRISGYKEMISHMQGTGVKTNISHVHVMNMAVDADAAKRAAESTLEYFKSVSESGVDLSYDVIPSATCSDFTHKSFGFFVSPLIRLAGSRKALAENFRDPKYRAQMHQLIEADNMMPTLNVNSDTCWLWELIILKHSIREYVGKSIPEIANQKKSSLLDTMMDLFAEDCDMIADFVSEDFKDSVDILCTQDNAMPCSDGSSYPKDVNLSGYDEIPLFPNSMNISYIPRYLKRYGCSDSKGIEWAVRQASGYVAERFNIANRGLIKENYYADIVILDIDNLRSYDEEDDPLQDPEGIEYVLVNGKVAVQNNQLLNTSAGRILRRGK